MKMECGMDLPEYLFRIQYMEFDVKCMDVYCFLVIMGFTINNFGVHTVDSITATQQQNE